MELYLRKYILKEAGTAILEYSVYEYAGIIPVKSIERNTKVVRRIGSMDC